MTDKSARETLIDVMRGLGFDFDTPEAQAAFDMLDVAGFAVVPKEPTPEMLRRMEAAQCFSTGCSVCGSAQDCYDVNARYEPDIAGAGAAWKAGILAASNPKEGGSDN